jgi:hypothetical protein
VGAWTDDSPPGGACVPINEARREVPQDRMAGVRDKVRRLALAGGNT